MSYITYWILFVEDHFTINLPQKVWLLEPFVLCQGKIPRVSAMTLIQPEVVINVNAVLIDMSVMLF